MNASNRQHLCPDCIADSPSSASRPATSTRRDFLRVAGAGAVALALPAWVKGDEGKSVSIVDSKVKDLYDSFSADQRKNLCFAFDDPLRHEVQANWAITEAKIEDLTVVQQDIVESIFQGLTSEEGLAKFEKQMDDDGGGMSQYHIALFGEPGQSKFEFVMTGRHMTIRADGNSVDKVAFGGPMVYGHAAVAFVEPADHKDNVFWYQGLRANEVFRSLDKDQRARALVQQAPKEDMIQHRAEGYDGMAVSEMSADQKSLVEAVMKDLLSPYRTEDVEEVHQILTANGGLDQIHFAFYQNDEAGKNADIGRDEVWDIWRLEGPGFVWHFRGAPHVHTWVNIAQV